MTTRHLMSLSCVVQEQLSQEIKVYTNAEGINMFSFHTERLQAEIKTTNLNLADFTADPAFKLNMTSIFQDNLCKHLWNDTSKMSYPPPCENELLNSGLETLLTFVHQKMDKVIGWIGEKS